MKHLTNLERLTIVLLYEKNFWSARKISNVLGIHIRTALLWINRYKKTGKIYEIEKTGRYRKTSKKEDKKLIELVKSKTKNFIIDDINDDLKRMNIFISNNTIIKRMKEEGYKCSFPIKKPALTDKQKQARLNFAINNYDTNWFLSLFSDEATIVKGSNFKKKIWIGPKTDNVIRTFKHPIKRNLYSCISSGGIEAFEVFNNNLNSDKYIEILDENIIPLYRSEYIYQQDNSPIHTAKKVKTYFNQMKINVINDWPPNSPDLNPIENLWFLLKYKLADEIINSDNFDEIIKRKLNEIKYEHIFNMISSMKIRICQVIQNNGDYTNY